MGKGASLAEIEQVYERRLDEFVRAAAAICSSREAGRDAVHDAFAAAVRGREAYRGDGSVEAWLWRAVVNAALRVRSRQPDPGPVGMELADAQRGNGSSRDELAEVRAAVAALPERQRLVLFLRYYADMDYQQIAETIGVRRGTVSAALHAAHNALRPTLEGARL